MNASLDHAQLLRILTEAADRLEGDWLLVGGAAAAIWFDPGRTTEDIDLVPLLDSMTARHHLLELAEHLALPVEALNSAADFFVRRIPGWERDLVQFAEGQRGRLFRPGPGLFLQLKLRRLTEVDFGDCEALLRYLQTRSETLATEPVLAALAALPATDDPALQDRRARLALLLA